MKKVFSTALFLGLALTHDLKLGFKSRFGNRGENAYDLSCDGAHGAVKYYVEGLPAGVTFEGSTILISSSAQAGSYTVRVRAVDELGQSAERVISLQISTEGASGSTGSTGANRSNSAGKGLPGAGGAGTLGGATGTGSGLPGAGGSGTLGGATGNSNEPRLTSLISNYSSTETTKVDYGTSGRYPEPNLPTGPTTPTGPNPTVLDINNNQATRTPANRNPITADDVALRAASDRLQNAVKGITNLLTIIDQANANRNKAQNDIRTYTQAYNDAITNQRAAQNDILAAETRISQIVSAINALTNTIADLTNKINQAVAARDALTRQKTTTLATIKDLEGKRGGLQEQLKGLDQDLANNVQKLSDQKSQCSSINDAVNAKQGELNARKSELAAANAARPGAVADIGTSQDKVDDLRRKLQAAEKDLVDAKNRLADLDSKIANLPSIIAGLQNDLAALQAKAAACAAEVARIQGLIDAVKGNKYSDIQKQINDLDNQLANSRSTVTDIDAQLAASQGPLEDLKAKLNQAQQDLTFIKSQKGDADNALRQAYQRGNDANNRVAFAKQNLDAVIKRYQDESKIASDANLNLERARAEQALARQGLEDLIAHYSNALPYAIVPNGNGVGAGTPYGNNPAGSALGPVRQNGNGAPGRFRIPSWTSYLSSAYGAGVSPAFPGSVTELYPFNFGSVTSGNQAANTGVYNKGLRGEANSGSGSSGQGGCFARYAGQAERATTGTVVAVRVDGFDLKAQDGKVHTVNVKPCTKLNANKPDYILETGHQAVAKGYPVAGTTTVIEASQVTCLQK